MKTGALIRASVRMGAIAGGLEDPAQFAQLEHFADCIGLAFQIRDDVLDVGIDLFEIYFRDNRFYPELFGCPHRFCTFARGKHCLGRNTSIIEAITTHLALFYQHDVNSKCCCCYCNQSYQAWGGGS